MTQRQLVVFTLFLGTLGGPASGQTSSQRRGATPPSVPASGKPVQEWRTLLIIKPVTRLRVEGLPKVDATMPPDSVEAVTWLFRDFMPGHIRRISNGRLSWKADVVVSPYPLEKVRGAVDGAYWPWAGDIQNDYDRFVPVGKYDNVFVFWLGTDLETHQGVRTIFGLSVGPLSGHPWAGHTAIHYTGADHWRSGEKGAEIFVHEWLHQLEAFYDKLGVKLPKGGLHGAIPYGYTHERRAVTGSWEEKFLNGTIEEPDGTLVGLGEKAWSLGTIREAAAVHTPEWLTPARMQTSLLSDGSFEDSTGPEVTGWAVRSVQGRASAASIDPGTARSGRAAVKLRTDPAGGRDAVCLQRDQAVKPHTRYVLAGWVKIHDVVNTEQKGGTAGGLLTIDDAYETSDPFLGTHDWSYRSVVFDSGERTSVKVGCRLGHIGTTGRGTAWFDDLVLIELGPSKPGAAVPSSSAGR